MAEGYQGAAACPRIDRASAKAITSSAVTSARSPLWRRPLLLLRPATLAYSADSSRNPESLRKLGVIRLALQLLLADDLYAAPPHKPEHEGDDEQNQCDPEQDFRAFHCGTGDTTEPKKGRNNRNNQKSYRPVQ